MNMGSEKVIDVIHHRTSIREYRDRPVTREQLEILVKAGMAAPSAMNKQPWRFIIVDDKEVLHALGKDIQTSKMVQQAPAAIVVCGDMQLAGEGWLQQYWIQDCSAASQNILLAITDMGLGGVWTSVYPAPDRMEKVSGILDLPGHIIPLNIIPVGYPDKKYSPRNKWDANKVHWNKFNP
ncbi:MAG: nitroreductase family protein [Bacteroidales bacterium]|jgi:nitroreductase|nr:nitroreductase family protein [Bacteroidales bacterium]